jgi:subtilase family serine protease
MPKPNLRFVGGIVLRATPGGPEVQRVRRGHRFLACYRVGNGGPVASGAFQVRGSAFGNPPPPPSQNHPGLASGATNDRCLLYPAVTLAPGNHLLQIKADATNAVAESSEADNVVQRVVLVTP